MKTKSLVCPLGAVFIANQHRYNSGDFEIGQSAEFLTYFGNFME